MGYIWHGFELAFAIGTQNEKMINKILEEDKNAIGNCYLVWGAALCALYITETALSIAVKTNNAKIVKKLLDSGALLAGLPGFEFKKLESNMWGEYLVSTIGASEHKSYIFAPRANIFKILASEKVANVIFNHAIKKIKSGELTSTTDLGFGSIIDWAVKLNNKKTLRFFKIKSFTDEKEIKRFYKKNEKENKEMLNFVLSFGERNVLYRWETRKFSPKAEKLGLYDYYEKFFEGDERMKKQFIPPDRPKKKKEQR
jgi:hypothetical protein